MSKGEGFKPENLSMVGTFRHRHVVTESKLRRTLGHHFPQKTFASEVLAVALAHLRGGHSGIIADVLAEEERLRRIERHAEALCNEYEQLHPSLRAALGAAGESIDGLAPMTGLTRRLRYTLHGKDPGPTLPSDGKLPEITSGLLTARLTLAALRDTSAQERKHDFEGKVQLVQAARYLWREATGRSAPLKASAGKFYGLLADLRDLIDENYSVESAMERYRSFKQKGET